jgi:hypothetical protein
MSSANLATKELNEPPKTISSLYTYTIRISLPLVYLAWCTNVPSFNYLIWRPRKNCNSPIMLISNSLLMSSANLATKELNEPPKTISSLYTYTIRISLPCLRRICLSHLKNSLKQEPPTYRTKL